MPKRHTTVRLSKLTDEQLNELKETFELTDSTIYTLAIDRLYRDLLRHGEVMEDAMYLMRRVQELESSPADKWPQWSGQDVMAVESLLSE